MNRPENISILDEKPGDQWTAQEIARVQRWWMERDQERMIWLAAFRFLGTGATHEDVEEAWVAFYSDEMEKCRKSYRPGGPDFATYTVFICFKRECIRRGEEIRKINKASVSLTMAAAENGTYDEEIVSPEPGPHVLLERQYLVKDVICFLEESSMPKHQKRAFLLKHFENKSNEEIADELQAEVGTVRVWAHRAATRVHEHLRKKGW